MSEEMKNTLATEAQPSEQGNQAKSENEVASTIDRTQMASAIKYRSKAEEKSSQWVQWALQLIQKFSAKLPDVEREKLIETLREQQGDSPSAKKDAVKRLKVVLLQDRANLNPALLDTMKADLVTVIAKYVEVDSDSFELNLEQQQNKLAMIAHIEMYQQASQDEAKTANSEILLDPLEVDDLIEQELIASEANSEKTTSA